jgi:endo-1,4-beta-D-glucanase Y/4-amino-4-deoxy-L-arabinose transferase-like glycosyltransferase
MSTYKVDIIIVAILLLVAGISQGWNMFHYPYFENDEATYISQAYTFIHFGKLAPYTYIYDHAPAGWIFMGLWLALTGNSSLFGSLLNSGRVFMLVLHIFSCISIYLIMRKITRHRLAGIVAILIFSLSPLGIYFQRRVLLDNIMIFWVLNSLLVLLYAKSRLRFVALSAIMFGIAVLSKENAIFFMPAYVYAVYAYGSKRNRLHAVYGWLGITCAVISIYFLYALLKGELFPAGSLLGGTKPHVSLLSTLAYQFGRGKAYLPWQKNSDFYVAVTEWFHRDPFVIYAGTISTIAGMILSIRIKSLRLITLLVALFWLFLIRGKLVTDLYVIPIIPLLGMLIGSIVGLPIYKLKQSWMQVLYSVLVITLIIVCYVHLPKKQYTVNETSNQLLAVAWIKKHVPRNSYIVSDNYTYPYLHEQGVSYPNEDYFEKYDLDPAIQNKFGYSWQNIQYIVLTDQVLLQIKNGAAPGIKQALLHSTLVASFTKNSTSYINISQFISTNGDWAQIYKVKSRPAIQLQNAWTSYKTNFIHLYGQVVDPSGPVTTSEGQAYALLRAVQNNDQQTFNGVYAWTKDHMEYRKSDSLFSWKWDVVNDKWVQADSNTATDADEDIADALLQAYGEWHDPPYLSSAKVIIHDIWLHEIVDLHNQYFVASSANTTNTKGQVLIDPSYIAPSYYKAFAKVDPTDNWTGLVTDSYTYLSGLQNKTTGFVPDWTMVDGSGKTITLSVSGLSTDYGYDAFRTGYRVAEDLPDPRAVAFLKPLTTFYAQQWQTRHLINAIYTTNGQAVSSYGDIPQYAVAALVLKDTGNNKLAATIYKFQVQSMYKNGAWGVKTNYYTQNWAAFIAEKVTP